MPTPAKVTISILLAAGIFAAGYMANRQPVPVVSSDSAKQLPSYTCPMHPQYRSDRAGDCPICGMRLETANNGDAGNKLKPASPDTPGMVQISAARQQLIGVRTDEVRRAPASHLLRVPGRITVDDQRLYRIIAASDGWILDLGPNTVGRFVRKDQLLASYYTTNLLATERLFLSSMAAPNDGSQREYTTLGTRTAGSAIQQFPVDSLRGLGMNDIQIEEIHRTRASAPSVNIYSPVAGFVLARNISPRQRFEKGSEFYRIADIGHVWVMTDIFEKDREFVKPGAMATIRYQGREFKARMSDALPQLDPQTRTLKTRFELDNPGNCLLPDMFVNVELNVETPAAVTVPSEGVIDSGRRKTVYVEQGNGIFEPRLVETGWRLGDRIQITGGLEPGERIVVSSNFLIDSESRMKLPAAAPVLMTEKLTAAKDPVCGMDVDPNSPQTLKLQRGGKAFYFCSELCRKGFEANPGKYALKEMAAQNGKGKRGPV